MCRIRNAIEILKTIEIVIFMESKPSYEVKTVFLDNPSKNMFRLIYKIEQN